MQTITSHKTICETPRCKGWEIWFPTHTPFLIQALLALCFCFAMSATSAHAATLTVTKTDDTRDGVCNADCSLREAIAAAASGDEIVFSLFPVDQPQTITLSHSFKDLVINKSLRITGRSPYWLTIHGGVSNFRVFNVNGSGVVVTLSGMTITGGFASQGANGSGINNNSGSSLTLSKCHVTGNYALSHAAGVFNAADSTLTISDSTISNNRGYAYEEGASGITNLGRLNVINSTISGNFPLDSSANGNISGGIWTSGTTTITSSTITNNTPAGNEPRAGGIYRAGTAAVTIRNSIIAGNTDNSTHPDALGAFTSEGYNLIGSASVGSGFTDGAKADKVGTLSSPLSPRLDPLMDYGGSTVTHRPQADSPVIDKGNSFGVMLDQLGAARPFDRPEIAPAPGGDNSDIGSVETFSRRPIIVTKIEDTFDDVCDDDCSLREAIDRAGDGRHIRFASPLFDTKQTITLSNELRDLVISESMTITGRGANLLTIQSGVAGNYRIFNVNGEGVFVTLSGMTLTGAQASGGSGGAINNNGGSNLTLRGVHVTGNSARSPLRVGGGIHNTADAALTITDSTISNNTATSLEGDTGGGGIYNEGTLNISNSTISGNTKTNDGGSSNNGGGIWTSGATVITNSTITDNAADSASSAGGIQRAGATGGVTIRNSIIAANRNNLTKPDVYGVFTSEGYNLIGNPGGTSGFNKLGDQIGTPNDPRNPLLKSLASNGGATPTHALNLGSPAIDAGKSFGATTDQRGSVRPVNNPNVVNATGGDGSDIGAFEAGYSSLMPAADGYVVGADAQRNTNYGTSAEVQVKRTLNPGAGRGRRGFMRFDTSAIPGNITRARLRIFARLTDASLPATSMILQKVTDTAWDELALTWNLQPQVASPDPLASVTVAGATGAWYEFDLTAYLQTERAAGRTVVSFRLINQSSTGTSGASFTSVNSKEAASNQPQLIIEQ